MSTNPSHLPGFLTRGIESVWRKIDAKRAPRDLQKVVQGCGTKAPTPQKNTKTPCDVNLLQVAAFTGKTAVGSLKAAARRIYEAVPADAPARIQSDLKSYDLVIELVSAYTWSKDTETGGPALEEIAEVAISSSWYGACPLKPHHPLVAMHPHDSADGSLEKEWHSAEVPKTKVPARTPGFFGRKFGWHGFPKGDPLLIDIAAQSCGVHFSKTPVTELKTLLRVFPKDEWSVQLTLPAASEGSYGTSKKKDLASGGVTTEKETSSESFGAPRSKSESSQTTDAKGRVEKQSDTLGGMERGKYVETSIETTREHGKTVAKYDRRVTTGNILGESGSSVGFYSNAGEKAKGKEWETKPSLKIRRNGAELDVAKVVDSMIHVVQTGKEAFHDFKKLLKIVPRIGYTLDMSFSFLEGSLSYERGYRLSETLRGDRYTAVTPYIDVGGSLKIVEASIEMGIGFDIVVPNIVDWFETQNILEVIVKLAGSIGIDCSIDCTAGFQDRERTVEVAMEPNTKFKVNLVGTAMAMGIGIRSELGVRSDGLYLKGQAIFTHADPPIFGIDTGLASGEAYGYYFVDAVVWDTSGHFEHPLWGENSFYKGDFPRAAE